MRLVAQRQPVLLLEGSGLGLGVVRRPLVERDDALPRLVDELLADPGAVRWLSEQDIAERLRELREDTTSWLGRDFSGQFSLAGAQAKTALLLQDGHWGLPSGSAATSHILKPAVAGFDDHDLNEHLCLDAARRAGLVVARTRVERFEDESAIVVDRYDRRMVDGKLMRIHQEDICQALSVDPTRKYQNTGGPGARDVARLLGEVMPVRAADDAVWRFLDALVWNWLIVGTDAHAKNYSLLLAGADARMAPLYDIASALPYDVHERKLRFAMKIGDDYAVLPYHDPWQAAARELDLDADAVHQRILELAARAPDAFAASAASPEVAALGRPLPERLVSLVADRVERCLGILGESSAKVARVAPDAYARHLSEIVEATSPQTLDSAGGPALIAEATEALHDAVASEPRDQALVRERMLELAARALRVVRAIGGTEPPPGFANPTEDRIAAMIDDYAPNVANLHIATDDPVARLVDEMVKAADRYVSADPRSIYGSAQERLRSLFRVLGLGGRGLSLLPGASFRS